MQLYHNLDIARHKFLMLILAREEDYGKWFMHEYRDVQDIVVVSFGVLDKIIF